MVGQSGGNSRNSANARHRTATGYAGTRSMMDVSEMTPVEIQRAGLAVLARELGPVGFIRFVQQYELGYGDYTVERHQWLDDLTIDEVLSLVQSEQDMENKNA